MAMYGPNLDPDTNKQLKIYKIMGKMQMLTEYLIIVRNHFL